MENKSSDTSEKKWIDIQKNTVTKWVNSYLAHKGIEITDLYEDFSDGTKLIQLLQIVTRDKVVSNYNPTPKFRIQKIENLNGAFKYLQEQCKLPLTNIGSSDIIDKNPKLILGLMWTLIKHFQLTGIAIDGVSGKEGLLLWCQRSLHEYQDINVKNFTTDWSDGISFCALIHSYNKDLMHEFPTLQRSKPLYNLSLAFDLLQNNFGLAKLLNPEDIISSRVPDEHSMITYISSIFKIFTSNMEKKKSVRIITRALDLTMIHEHLYTEIKLFSDDIISTIDSRLDFYRSINWINSEQVINKINNDIIPAKNLECTLKLINEFNEYCKDAKPLMDLKYVEFTNLVTRYKTSCQNNMRRVHLDTSEMVGTLQNITSKYSTVNDLDGNYDVVLKRYYEKFLFYDNIIKQIDIICKKTNKFLEKENDAYKTKNIDIIIQNLSLGNENISEKIKFLYNDYEINFVDDISLKIKLDEKSNSKGIEDIFTSNNTETKLKEIILSSESNKITNANVDIESIDYFDINDIDTELENVSILQNIEYPRYKLLLNKLYNELLNKLYDLDNSGSYLCCDMDDKEISSIKMHVLNTTNKLLKFNFWIKLYEIYLNSQRERVNALDSYIKKINLELREVLNQTNELNEDIEGTVIVSSNKLSSITDLESIQNDFNVKYSDALENIKAKHVAYAERILKLNNSQLKKSSISNTLEIYNLIEKKLNELNDLKQNEILILNNAIKQKNDEISLCKKFSTTATALKEKIKLLLDELHDVNKKHDDLNAIKDDKKNDKQYDKTDKNAVYEKYDKVCDINSRLHLNRRKRKPQRRFTRSDSIVDNVSLVIDSCIDKIEQNTRSQEFHGTAMITEIKDDELSITELMDIAEETNEKLENEYHVYSNPYTVENVNSLRLNYKSLKEIIQIYIENLHNEIELNKSSHLTKEQLAEVKEIFKQFDKDNNDKLNEYEFIIACQGLGINSDSSVLSKAYQDIVHSNKKSTTGSRVYWIESEITFKQFLEFCSSKLETNDSKKDVILAFQSLSNGNVTITFKQLKNTLENQYVEFIKKKYDEFDLKPLIKHTSITSNTSSDDASENKSSSNETQSTLDEDLTIIMYDYEAFINKIYV